MPLLSGKANIGHNITTEEEHGKPYKQALAIALHTAGVPKKNAAEQRPVSYAEQMHASWKRATGG